MDTQQGFTLKQHINYLILSLLVAITSIYLDFQYNNLQYNTKEFSKTKNVTPSATIFSHYEVTHGTSIVIEA